MGTGRGVPEVLEACRGVPEAVETSRGVPETLEACRGIPEAVETGSGLGAACCSWKPGITGTWKGFVATGVCWTGACKKKTLVIEIRALCSARKWLLLSHWRDFQVASLEAIQFFFESSF